MRIINKISTTLCMSLAIVAANHNTTYADPGNVEAVNSASEDRRNIVGIEISTATDAQRAAVGCSEKGVLISAVIPGHPAAVAGLKAGDILLQIGEDPVTVIHEALERMNGLDAGRTYPFVVWRKDDKGNQMKLVINVLVEKVQEKAIGKIS